MGRRRDRERADGAAESEVVLCAHLPSLVSTASRDTYMGLSHLQVPTGNGRLSWYPPSGPTCEALAPGSPGC